jgi:hypothetical protein
MMGQSEVCLRCSHPFADHTFNYSDRQRVPSCAARGCTCLAMAWKDHPTETISRADPAARSEETT